MNCEVNWYRFKNWCHELCPGGQDEDDLDLNAALSEITATCLSADGTCSGPGNTNTSQAGSTGNYPGTGRPKPLQDVTND